MNRSLGRFLSQYARRIVASQVILIITYFSIYAVHLFANIAPKTRNLLWRAFVPLLSVIIAGYVLTAVALYAQRNYSTADEYRPSKWYYLMVVPLYLNTILLGIEYLIVSRRED